MSSCLVLVLVVGLGHGVQGATVLEPLDLWLVEGVGELNLESSISVGWVDSHGQWLADSELGLEEVNLVS
jgi:hypothetical protein